MGSATPPKTARNKRIYRDFKSGKFTRQQLQERFNISERRLYKIVEWVTKTTT